MNSEFEAGAEEPKDRVWMWWAAVVVAIVVMVGALWVVHSRRELDVTRVRARHILISFDPSNPSAQGEVRRQAEEIRERLLNGESFSKLAREYSGDEYSSARGGDLGYYRRGVFEPQFEEYVWSGPLNEISDLITTSRGFHIIEIMDRSISEADQYEMDLERKAKELELQKQKEADEAAAGDSAAPAPAPQPDAPSEEQ